MFNNCTELFPLFSYFPYSVLITLTIVVHISFFSVFSNLNIVLWHVDPLLGNDGETQLGKGRY
jgi:hypothetical protein